MGQRYPHCARTRLRVGEAAILTRRFLIPIGITALTIARWCRENDIPVVFVHNAHGYPRSVATGRYIRANPDVPFAISTNFIFHAVVQDRDWELVRLRF